MQFMRPVADRMAQARRIVVESARFNLRSDIFRTINMPMMVITTNNSMSVNARKRYLDRMAESPFLATSTPSHPRAGGAQFKAETGVETRG